VHPPLKYFLNIEVFFCLTAFTKKFSKKQKKRKKNNQKEDMFNVFQPAVILPRMYL